MEDEVVVGQESNGGTILMRLRGDSGRSESIDIVGRIWGELCPADDN